MLDFEPFALEVFHSEYLFVPSLLLNLLGCQLQVMGKYVFSSVAQLCLTLCDPMDCSMPGFPVHHQLPVYVFSLQQNALCHSCI